MPLRKLILMTPLLMAAGEAPDPCGQASAAARAPAQSDLTGRPMPGPSLVNPAVVLAPKPVAIGPCGGAPSTANAVSDVRSDALHAVPPPELPPLIPTAPGH